MSKESSQGKGSKSRATKKYQENYDIAFKKKKTGDFRENLDFTKAFNEM